MTQFFTFLSGLKADFCSKVLVVETRPEMCQTFMFLNSLLFLNNINILIENLICMFLHVNECNCVSNQETGLCCLTILIILF